MSSDWEIRKRGDACQKSQRAFEDGEMIYSRLVFTGEGYEREDFAADAWEDSLAQGALSTWKTVVRFPPPVQQEALKKETAEGLLRQFIALDDHANTKAIYILGLMLERKRILVEKDVQVRDDGTKVRVYEHRGTGEVFMILDPELRLAELEEVQDEVALLLGGSLPAHRQKETPAEGGQVSL